MERPSKRTKLLSDSEDSDSDQSVARGNGQHSASLKINKDYAQRFEHNKQREERHRLEEKYQDDEDEDDSSSEESEDDDADLVTADLDDEIMSTLKAIKSKDPRVYDQNNKFYQEFDPETGETVARSKENKDKPMTLKDYHRENLMAGHTGAEDDHSLPKRTPFQEQEDLRRQVTTQMHAMADGDDQEDDSDGEFIVKAKGVHETVPAVEKRITNADVANAHQDPETFLSNFMTSQGWRSASGVNAHAFDSDDSEDDDRADAFEAAYNLRFEDPATANETLKSFARDDGTYTVRREKVGGRKLAREKEKEVKEHAKRERDEDRARLRKLKIDDAEKKLKAIKHAAGLRGKQADIEQWRDILDGEFDDAAWDQEMEKQFGAAYYAENDAQGNDKDDEIKKHAKKPKWDSDIDIKDLVPDFDEDDKDGKKFELTDDEDALGPESITVDESVEAAKPKSKKDREKAKQEAKARSRRERRAIEDIVDASLPVAAAQTSGFRYRDTSPTSFGMSSRDILFATDAQLNEFAGLKKLAAFRDAGRKAKDKKKLGKKARLREWRKEVFGNADGFVEAAAAGLEDDTTVTKEGNNSKKRKRRNNKAKKTDAVA